MQARIAIHGAFIMASKKSNLKKSEDPGYRLPPEQRPLGSLPAERGRPAAEQRTSQARRAKTVPERHK
jgi:hypothetical protein